MTKQLPINPEMLDQFPPCPYCGEHGRIEWWEYWVGTEYIMGAVRCSKCGWYPEEAEIELGLGMGRMFLPSAVQGWVDGAKEKAKEGVG